MPKRRVVKNNIKMKVRADGKCDTGRPTSMTPETIDKLIYAFSIGCSDEEACLYANIGMSTLYDYQKKDKSFSERKAILKKKPVLKARTVIIDALNNKNVETAKWFLEKKCKDEFGKQPDTVVNNQQTVYVTKQDEDLANDFIDSIIQG